MEYFSAKWLEFTGFSLGDLLDGKVWDTVHPVSAHPFFGWFRSINDILQDDIGDVRTLWQESINTGRPMAVEYRCRKLDGSYRWMLNRALPMYDDSRSITKWVGTCSDIQKQFEATSEACTLWEHLRCLVMNSETCIWSINSDYVITLFEGSEKSSIGQVLHLGVNIVDVAKDLSEFLAPLEAVIQGKVPFTTSEVSLNGTWIHTRYIPVFSRKFINDRMEFDPGKVVGVIGVTSDITSRKLASIALEARTMECNVLAEKESAAQEDSRMKTKFMATMSHEIRT